MSHIPGDYGWPILGQTLSFLYKPVEFPRHLYERYGSISRGHVYFERAVNMLGPEANQFVLANRDGVFSAYRGWEPILGQLFPRGLMLRDGDDHRGHRRIMQVAFKKDALAEDLEMMRPIAEQRIAAWPGQLQFYPAIKDLTLDIAAKVFLGLSLGEESKQLNRAFVDVVAASMALLRFNVPGTLFDRGLRGRAYLQDYFAARIDAKRKQQTPDLFSRLCNTESEEGEKFSPSEIVDHMIFTMMAAHDTTTSALTTISYLLAKHSNWQDRVRDELSTVGEHLEYNDLDKLELCGHVFREALRLYPPLPSIRRRSIKECEFNGYRIPAETAVNIFNHFTHHMPEYWQAPETFDPERFARNEHRQHPFQFIPFGAGAHTCIGLHFAEIQVKTVMHALLSWYRLSVPEDYKMPYQMVPISKPRNGLPLTLQPI